MAHIYGQNIVGAESMTSRGPAWSFSPNNLKKVADLEFALGVNRFEIHESTHQPVADMAPGLTLGPYGLWFNRNDTWAEEAEPWVTYLARCSYLLQQGHYSADVAYFYGEEGPLTAVFGWKAIDDAPDGYAFDFVNSDVVLHELSFKDGRLVTPGGTSYRILYLGGRSQRMTLPVLRQIKDLVAQGAVLVGNRPTDSPSLADDRSRVSAHRGPAVGEGSAAPNHGMRAQGRGREECTRPQARTMCWRHSAWRATLNTPRPEPDANLMFLHRKLADGDVYFVDNRNDRAENVDATFRVDGKAPELWDAATRRRHSLPRIPSPMAARRFRCISNRTEPRSLFFASRPRRLSRTLPEEKETVVAGVDDALNKDWTVSFEPNRGAPETAEFDRLTSWSESADPGVKYFSGSATYTKTIEVPASALSPGAHLWLDLGDVENIAEVAVNGKYQGFCGRRRSGST